MNHTHDASGADGLPPLRDVIARHGLRAKKSLGQNFILDLNLTCAIARAAGPLENRKVIEVGPGPGGLTRGLLREGAAHVIAVERDERAVPALEEIRAAYDQRLTIVSGDALQTKWLELLEPDHASAIVCANLPYGIATRLLVGWLLNEPWPPWYDKMVLMFQKEVAERIVAKPETKAYGRLSVLAQWRCNCRIVMTLPQQAFTPAPKVSSAVVEFIPNRQLQPPCHATNLGRVTAAAFGQRRKMLRSSLKQITPMPELLLAKAGIDPMARAETLSVQDFAALGNALEA